MHICIANIMTLHPVKFDRITLMVSIITHISKVVGEAYEDESY
jgi:hypothetical protein